MTPLTHLPDSRVQCPTCTVTYNIGEPLEYAQHCMCEVPGCKRLFQQGGKRGSVIMNVRPADMEAGLA